MTALIYEIIWIRPLSLVFGTTIYAVSTIIASFILGLAVGSWLAGRYTDRLSNPLRFFAFVQLGIGFYGILLLPIFATLPGVYLDLFTATFPNQGFFMFIQVLISMAMISIPASLMGATLPLMMRTYSEEFTTIGKDVGKLDASNSFGAVFGTLAAGFLLIPILGIQNSIILTASINVVLGIIILSTKKYLKYQHLIIIIIIIVPFFTFVPSYDPLRLNLGLFVNPEPGQTAKDLDLFLGTQPYEILFFEESLYSSILVTEKQFGDTSKQLRINGKIQCSTDQRTISGLVNIATIPSEVFEYNYGKPQNTLNIGLGCGITSQILSQNIETTTIEIDPVVVEANKFFHEPIDHRLIIDDARNWLLRNNEKFDLITSEPSDPYQNNGMLFTVEFFSLLNSRLSENGVVSQWVPLFGMDENDLVIFYNTFHSVFPYVYIYQMEPDNLAQLFLIGSQKPLNIKENNLYIASNMDLEDIKSELNTDDKPLIEFSSARYLYHRDPDWASKIDLTDNDIL